MKIIKNVTLYKCDHCGKKYQRIDACARHEKACGANPNNFTDCSDCVALERKTAIVHMEYTNEHVEHEVFWCKNKNNFLYPPKVERSRRGPFEAADMALLEEKEFDKHQNERMPRKGKCDKNESFLPF